MWSVDNTALIYIGLLREALHLLLGVFPVFIPYTSFNLMVNTHTSTTYASIIFFSSKYINNLIYQTNSEAHYFSHVISIISFSRCRFYNACLISSSISMLSNHSL